MHEQFFFSSPADPAPPPVSPDAAGRDVALERSVLRGLAAQWERETWGLSEKVRARLRCPLFALADGRAVLGQWFRDRRLITLNRRHALCDDWVAVRQTLLHEMAHQLADEILGGDVRPHGDRFRAACGLLRVAPDAAAQASAGEAGWARLTARVHKLLALAGSANRHEAELAMCKAHDLMARHNVDRLACGLPRAYESVCVGEPRLRHGRTEHRLAVLLGEFYFVQPIWIGAFVREKGRMGRVLEISGTHENIRMAEYVHAFVRRFIEEAWPAYVAGRATRRGSRDDFGSGIVEGFTRKLTAPDEPAAGGPGHALARVSDPQLRAYFRHRHPHVRQGSSRGRRRDREAYEHGMRTGKRLVLHRPLETTGEAHGRLLT
jgi:hypothetical protein